MPDEHASPSQQAEHASPSQETVPERLNELEVRLAELQGKLPGTQEVVRLAQIVALVVGIVSAALGLAGLKTLGDIESMAEREVRRRIPAAEEAKILFQDAQSAAAEYQGVLDRVREVADDIESYKDILAERPNPRRLVLEASEAVQNGNHQRAMDSLVQLVDSEDVDAGTLQSAATIASQELGLRALAIQLAERAHQMVPDNPEYYSDYLELLAEDPARVEEAQQAFKELGDRFPTGDRIFQSLGNFYQRIWAYEDLRAYLDGLIADHDDSGEPISHVVFQLRARAGDELNEAFETVTEWWEQSLALGGSEDPNVLRQYGTYLADRGRCDEAERVFSQNIDTVLQGRSLVQAGWAAARLDCGRHEEACSMATEIVMSHGGSAASTAHAILQVCYEIGAPAGLDDVQEAIDRDRELLEMLRTIEETPRPGSAGS